MVNKYLLSLYLVSIGGFYLMFPRSSDPTSYLFEANCAYSLVFARTHVLNMILVGIINSLGLSYISSGIAQVQHIEVSIRTRIQEGRQQQYFLRVVIKSLAWLCVLKLLLDLVSARFREPVLLSVMAVSSFITFLLYGIAHLHLSFSGVRQDVALLVLIAVSFIARLLYTLLPFFVVLVPVPYQLSQYPAKIILIKTVIVVISAYAFSRKRLATKMRAGAV